MTTNTPSHAGRTDAAELPDFYVPGAGGRPAEPSVVERLATALYERHRLLTRRLE